MSSSSNNDNQNKMPRIVISAPQGHSGKTVVSMGLCALLRQRGLVVQPFKKGPDYIDPSWLTAAAGRDCHNLDTNLMPEDVVCRSFGENCWGVDFVLIEGAMGLYDSYDPMGNGSTASLARLLKAPVILIVNVSHITRSVAALIYGFMKFEPDTRIAGVILNGVAGKRHHQKLVQSIERYCDIPVVGSFPRDEQLTIDERHLGLVPYMEAGKQTLINRLATCMEKYLDIDKILDIANGAEVIKQVQVPCLEHNKRGVSIGVIRDKIFTFYYQENLLALERAGAELITIDSINDKQLPDIDALYIGGGFPELFLPELEANSALRCDIARAIEHYLPVYAECAGLMYLCKSISWQGKKYEMLGIIPASIELCTKPQGHGYTSVKVVKENPFFPTNSVFWGHEFHYSRVVSDGMLDMACHLEQGHGVCNSMDGIIYKNLFATYIHIHTLGIPQWAISFCDLAARYKAGVLRTR